MHRREDAHAKPLEALLHAPQGVDFALGGPELDTRPAQANLLEEE